MPGRGVRAVASGAAQRREDVLGHQRGEPQAAGAPDSGNQRWSAKPARTSSVREGLLLTNEKTVERTRVLGSLAATASKSPSGERLPDRPARRGLLLHLAHRHLERRLARLELAAHLHSEASARAAHREQLGPVLALAQEGDRGDLEDRPGAVRGRSLAARPRRRR